jgi:hypothetical protein
MFSFLKKPTSKAPEKVAVIPSKPLNYHPKVILAWAKAIEGDTTFIKWLDENNFSELAMAAYAIHLKEDARQWLIQNGYPHLMAMINAAEGNEQAQKWLLHYNFELLYHIALAVEEEEESWKWLKTNATQDIFILASTIRQVKNKIEENHNDVHSFGKD